MTFDSDKTPRILQDLRESVASGDYKAAIELLRHADAGGRLRSDATVLSRLRAAVGERQASGIIRTLATDPCRYCDAGRERCEECGGKGWLPPGQVCRDCAGFGVVRCPFCNGTAFAGYDFVPRGLRTAVMELRVNYAERRLSELAGESSGRDKGAVALTRMIMQLDGCRGILANAVEQVQLHSRSSPGTGAVFSPGVRMRVEQRCRQLNGRAEAAIRRTLLALAELHAEKAQRSGLDDEHRMLYAHRARSFARLGRGERFDESVFQTPRSLRRNAAP